MHEETRVEELDAGSPVVQVAPIGTRGRVPKPLLLGLVVGVVAFVAGIGVASAGPTTRAPVSPPPVEASAQARDVAPSDPVGGAGADADPGASDPGTAPATAPATAGDSAFLAAFDPAALLAAAPGGDRCTLGDPHDESVPRTRRDGPRMTFQRSWIAWCRMPSADRQSFMLGVLDGILDVVPADTFGYGVSAAGTGDALLPYAEPPLAGTVAVTADDAGPGLAVAIVASEWLIDVAR